MAARRPPVLLGRVSERHELDRVLQTVRGGHSEVLAIRGEAGVGKTALLHYCIRQASGFRVARITGAKAEMELPFAGLHQLCAPMLARRDALPEPQRKALGIALGMSSGMAPDRFLVGLATLSLLSCVAEERPLLCVVEDAQWLDGASTLVLGFVGRRLLAESVAMVLAVREPSHVPDFDDFPGLLLAGLDEPEAQSLLARVVPGRLDPRIRDRIVAETGGNPLALLELPQTMSSAGLAGGFEGPVAPDLPSQIEASYLRRLGDLPPVTRQLILLAAADPVGDAALVWRAAHRLGILPNALGPAAAAGLLEIDDRVRFRHPLVRSAVYGAASPPERQRVHQALAEVSDPDVDPDRRAWHQALASADPDEDLAAELEHSAGRAQQRGGIAAAAAFLERAAAFSVDAESRGRRALAAADAHHQAGAPAIALSLLAAADAGPIDPLRRAQAQMLRAEIAFTTNHGSDAPPLLLDSAQQLESLDVTLARETYLDALTAAQFAGRLAPGAVVQVAQVVRAAPAAAWPRAPDLLLDGLAVMVTDGHGAAAPLLKQALHAFRDGDISANGGFRWLWLAEEAAQEMWDHDTWLEFAQLHVRLVREAGALSVLPLALSAVVCANIYAGDLVAAAALTDEVQVAAEATGTRLAPYGALILAAWQGREADLVMLSEATLTETSLRGEGIGLSCCQWVMSILRNGLGEYQAALDAARELMEPARKLDWTVNVTLPELIEAAIRTGHRQEASTAFEQLYELTRPSGTNWGLGIQARCRALLSKPDVAEPHYREAIERLTQTRVRGENARAHLLYGEWLRREGRRVDARAQLHTAYDMFTAMRIDAFAERTRHELLATGATARKRDHQSRDDLTPQEEQIARLARGGLSNPEIGERLFLSPRTVEWHLKKVFVKLGIKSRMALHEALPSHDHEAARA